MRSTVLSIGGVMSKEGNSSFQKRERELISEWKSMDEEAQTPREQGKKLIARLKRISLSQAHGRRP